MNWERVIARLEVEARAILPDEVLKAGQPIDRLTLTALLVLNGVKKLKQERKLGRVDHLLDVTVDLFSSYEEMWILRAVPEYVGRKNALTTSELLTDMRRGPATTKRLIKTTATGCPKFQKEKGNNTLKELKLWFDENRLKKHPVASSNVAAIAAKKLQKSPRHIRNLINKHHLR